MKKNLTFQTVFKRKNLIKEAIFYFILGLASYPRLIIEPILRKNFGERYFSLASAITVLVILAVMPPLVQSGQDFVFTQRLGLLSEGETNFWLSYSLWYLFIISLGYFSFLRWKEVRRNPSVFDFARYSRSTGKIYEGFFKLNLFGWHPTLRQIEIFVEPSIFFLAGIFLKVLGQPLGTLFLVASICYSISYAAAYKEGDDLIMDSIDQIIINGDMYDAFVNDPSNEQSHGFRFYGTRPTSKEDREKLYDFLAPNEDESVVS